MGKKRTSLSELAEAVGLSKTLVSMVLNGKGDQHKISAKTQKLVKEKAKELNYSPHSFARKLRTGKSNLVGLIVPDISNIFYARIARVMEDYLHQFNYNLIILSTDEQPEREKKVVDFLLGWQVDGILVASCLESSDFYKNDGRFDNTPFVLIDRFFQNDDTFSKVVVDNVKGSSMAVEYLAKINCKSITYLNITPTYLSPLKERKEAFVKDLKTYKLKGEVVDVDYRELERDIQNYLGNSVRLNKLPDAIFTSNNSVAIALMNVLKDKELNKEIHFCSFDDHPSFDLISKKVTSVCQPVDDIGEQSIKMLMSKINKDKEIKNSMVLPLKLKKR